LDESKSPEFNYPTGSIYASVNAFFLEKVAIHESKYDGDISGSENITFDLPQGLICSGGGYVNIKKQNGNLIASVLAPDDYNVANSPIDIGGNVFSLQATEGLNVSIIDSADVDLDSNIVGSDLVAVDRQFNVYVNGTLDQSFSSPAFDDLTINITA